MTNNNVKTVAYIGFSDAYGEGWIFVVTPDDAAQYDGLLDPDAYQDLLDQA